MGQDMSESELESFKNLKEGRLLKSFYKAAFDLIDQKDVDEISVKDITDITGVSRQTLYNYFASKNSFFNYALFRGVYEKMYQSTPREVITSIIPKEFEDHTRFYTQIARTTGTDSFESFFTQLLKDYCQYVISNHWNSTVINRSMETSLDIYVKVAVQHFMHWLTDGMYNSIYSASDIGLSIFKDIPSSLLPAFDTITKIGEPELKNPYSINLGIGLWVGQEFVAKLVEEFHKECPDIMVNIMKSGHYHSVKRYDIGIEISSYEFFDDHYDHYPLCNHGLCMLVSRKNPLSQYDHARITMFQNERVILPGYREMKMIKRGLAQYAESKAFNFERIFCVNEMFGIPDYVIMKEDLGVILRSTLDGVHDNDVYKVVRIDDFGADKPLEIPLHLYIQKEYELSKNERRFIQCIMNYAKNVKDLYCPDGYIRGQHHK